MYLFLLFTVIAWVAANPISAPNAVEGRTMNEIYQAALKEKSPLRVFWSGSTPSNARTGAPNAVELFTRLYPGIVLDVKVDESEYLASAIDRIYQETNGSDNGADVVALQTVHDLTRWRDEKRLMPYKVIPFNDIYPQFVDPNGAYTAAYMLTFGSILYNPSFTANSTLPTTYAEFLNPEWADKLILTHPSDNEGVLYLFTLITQKYGFEFIDALVHKQRALWVRGTSTPARMIAQNSTHSVSFAGVSGTPGVAALAPQDTHAVGTKAGAIFATTKVPESAKLFMNFLLSDAGQTFFDAGGFSVRRKYDTAGIFEQEYLDPVGYAKFMADRAEVERWRLQFESFLGPPQGLDPVMV